MISCFGRRSRIRGRRKRGEVGAPSHGAWKRGDPMQRVLDGVAGHRPKREGRASMSHRPLATLGSPINRAACVMQCSMCCKKITGIATLRLDGRRNRLVNTLWRGIFLLKNIRTRKPAETLWCWLNLLFFALKIFVDFFSNDRKDERQSSNVSGDFSKSNSRLFQGFSEVIITTFEEVSFFLISYFNRICTEEVPIGLWKCGIL